MKIMPKNRGQVIVTLILVMTVALAIGLSIIQRSLTDISTSTKVEQSARAFSAAEAGIEKYLGTNTICSPTCNFPISQTGSTASVEGGTLIPCLPGVDTCPSGQQDALEYPALSKEDIAHIWLANPTLSFSPPTNAVYYKQTSLDVFWGKQDTYTDASQKPAIEIKVLWYDNTSGSYKIQNFYLDSNSSRTSGPLGNGFTDAIADPNSSCNNPTAKTEFGNSRPFYCKTHLDLTGLSNLMLLRARILYSSQSQPFAVQAPSNCSLSSGCYLFPQAKVFTSTGVAGETQRKVQVFKINNVVPYYFDYAIFSAGDINK